MSNSLVDQKWGWVEGSHKIRMELIDTLSDADLQFNPGGQNMTLGALLKEIGEIEYSYIESLKTFKQDWSYRNNEPDLEKSVERIKAWYQTLDTDMKATVSAFTDEDLEKTIDRGGYAMPLDVQLEVYTQALLIFFGKASIYLKAMSRPLPKDIQEWIG